MKIETRRVVTALAVVITMIIGVGCEDRTPADVTDWPMYGRDSLRSNHTPFTPQINTFVEEWQYLSPQQPQPAWYGPAIWDGYAKSDVLPSMRNFDLVYQPIIVGDMLYFGSSGDDALHAIDLTTGEEKWHFRTNGPIRIAPTYHKGRLYFGSDDGFAYSIDAEDGDLNWKFAPQSDKTRLLCDGKFISFYPIRTGVTIKGNTAYFAASLIPWKSSFLCGIDIETGRPTSPSSFIKSYANSTFEGSLVATDQFLIQPQGRVSPSIFDRETGEETDRISGANGTFVIVTPEGEVSSGGATRGLGLALNDIDKENSRESKEERESKLVSFGGGKALIVASDTAFVITEKVIAAHNREDKSLIWSRDNFFSIAMIKTGKYIIAGGVDKVEAFSSATGELVWSTKVQGKAHGVIYAKDRLIVSTDEGRIYSFKAGDKVITPQEDVRAYSNAITRSGVISHQKASPTSDENRTKDEYRLKITPRATFVSKDKATVQWETKSQAKSQLVLKGEHGSTSTYGSGEAISNHKVTVDNLRKNRYYSYHIETTIDGEIHKTLEYDLDNFFNYNLQDINSSDATALNISDNVVTAVDRLMERGAPTSGVALIWGVDKEQLVVELGKRSHLKIIAIDKDLSKVESIRESLMDLGIYGERISVYHQEEDILPFPPGIFNLIVSATGAEEATPDEIVRLLKPSGGVAIIDNKEMIADWKQGKYDNLEKLNRVEFYFDSEGWFSLKKGAPWGAGEWSHLYGRPNNSAFGGEEFWGAEDVSDFEIAWMGRPGPRYHADRSGRKVGPLSMDGKLFLSGLNRVIAMDAYNGKILWSCELPGFMRFNMPRDCSNWSADDNYLYVVINSRCLQIDHNTGKMVGSYPVVKPESKEWRLDWEFIANDKNNIYGTATREGASYELFSGGWGWYDGNSGDQTFQICSDNIFAYKKSEDSNMVDQFGAVATDKSDAKAESRRAWTYDNGVILNVTITIADNKVWFVENRSKYIKQLDSRRLGQKELWKDLHLVCLNAIDGTIIYSKPLDITPGIPAISMSQSDGKVVMVASHNNVFYLYCHNDTTGEIIWKREVAWSQNHHGGHLSRPAIVGNKIFLRPAVIDLTTGEVISKDFPYGKCGTYACTKDAIFYRSGDVTMWNTTTKSHTHWTRLRPDCWLSTIPAQGMLLSPEGGGGCSCGNWLETSMGFAPIPQGAIAFSSTNAIGGLFQGTTKISVRYNKALGVTGDLRYTIDGTKPTLRSPLFTEPIEIDDKVTFTVGLFDKDGVLLKSGRKRYIREFPIPEIRPDTTTEKGELYTAIDKITPDGTTYYTVDGTLPNPNSTIYKAPFSTPENTMVKAITVWKTESNKIRTSRIKKQRVATPKKKKKKK